MITSRQAGRVDRIEYDEYCVSSYKGIIETIDDRLAAHFGFTPVEVDAISAFDLQFRVSGDAGELTDD